MYGYLQIINNTGVIVTYKIDRIENKISFNTL